MTEDDAGRFGESSDRLPVAQVPGAKPPKVTTLRSSPRRRQQFNSPTSGQSLFQTGRIPSCLLSHSNWYPSSLSLLAIMADSPVDVLLKGSSGRSARGLLRIIILVTIAAAAVSSRLFSVIRMCLQFLSYRLSNKATTNSNCVIQALRVSSTNVCIRPDHSHLRASNSLSTRTRPWDSTLIYNVLVDPWFNFRATKYLVENGFYDFWDWFDDRTFLLLSFGAAKQPVNSSRGYIARHTKDALLQVHGILLGGSPEVHCTPGSW